MRNGNSYRFGPFEFWPHSGRLKKFDYTIKLQPRPATLLAALLERPGETVSREELRKRLWPDTHVDFDLGIKVAAKKLRDALGDAADAPTYIRTVTGEGYCFIAPVEIVAPQPATTAQAPVIVGNGGSPPATVRRLEVGIASAVALLVCAILLGAWWSGRQRERRNPNGVWVLITSFENRTGDAVLDGTLEYATARELNQSNFVKVVPRERVEDALRLMRKPLNTRVDAAIGREICARDGSIPAFITGRIEKLGGTYVLNVEVIDAASGTSLASVEREEKNSADLARAIHHVSDGVRSQLGEAAVSVSSSQPDLEKVTTPSLAALQLYTQAAQALGESSDVAAMLLEEALNEDPKFASAHFLLGQARFNHGHLDEAKEHWKRAFELAGGATVRERLLIEATYYERVEGDRSKAAQTLEALLAHCPDDYSAISNLARLYDQNSNPRATELIARRSDLRPNDLGSAFVAAVKLTRYRGIDPARPYAQRANLLLKQQQHVDPMLPAMLALWPARRYWLNANPVPALAIILDTEQHSVPVRTPFIASVYGEYHLSLGELTAAERCFEIEPDADARESELARVAYVRRDWQTVRSHLKTGNRVSTGNFVDAWIMIEAGMWHREGDMPVDAKNLMESRANSPVDLLRGEMKLKAGSAAEAITLLERGLQKVLPDAPAALLGQIALAQAHDQLGQHEEALHLLQRVPDQWDDGRPDPSNGGFFWLEAQLRLADAYRAVGRYAEADATDAKLRKLLALADHDHPLLSELQQHGASAPAVRRREIDVAAARAK